MEKDAIERFIQFIMDITNDEFDYFISPYDANFYFKNGGCLELVKVLKHFIPDTKYMYSKKNEHFAASIYDIIYDCDGINVTIDDFQEILDEDIIKYEGFYGKDVYFEHMTVHEALINELKNIGYTDTLLKEINDSQKEL